MQLDTLPEPKIIRTYTINPMLFSQFKRAADKDMRKLSNVIEQAIRRYVESKS